MTVTKRRARLLATVGVVCAIAAVAGFVGVLWYWGVGFEEAEAFGMATTSTDDMMVASFWVAMIGVLGAVTIGLLVAADRKRRQRSAA